MCSFANLNIFFTFQSVCDSGDGSACDPVFNGPGFYMAAGGAAALQNLAHVLKEVRTHGWDVKVVDHTENMAMMSVQGPKSRAILQQLTEEDFSDQAFPFSTHKVVTIAGHKCRALRLSFVGEMGKFLLVYINSSHGEWWSIDAMPCQN